MSRKKQTVTEYMNDASFRIWQNRLKSIVLNLFQWDGLPDLIKEEYIEKALYNNGMALFFEDKNLGLMCLPCFNGRGVNVYEMPTAYRAVGFGYSEEYSEEECVLIPNNKLRTAMYEVVDYYAYRLTETDRSADVNVKAVKTPYIISCTDKDVLTLKKVYEKIDGNEPVIFADKSLDLETIKVIETKAEFIADVLSDYQKSILNDFLTFLGINTCGTEKKERLITSEANANNQLIENNVEIMLEARQRACEEINKKFGLDVSVKLRVEMEVNEDELDEPNTVSDNEDNSGVE